MKPKYQALIFLTCLLLLSTIAAKAQSAPNNFIAKHVYIENKIALAGYDAVAYFTQKKAVKGTSKFSSSIAGVIYHFSSEANKVLFIKNPSAYLPQYGGWCAYAMGDKGEKVEIDPETFKIINGKLYLFYNAYFNNTLKSWNKDEPNLKTKADANWLKINN